MIKRNQIAVFQLALKEAEAGTKKDAKSLSFPYFL
jgi:hypothetical protein